MESDSSDCKGINWHSGFLVLDFCSLSYVSEPGYLWMYWPFNFQPPYSWPRPLVTTPRLSPPVWGNPSEACWLCPGSIAPFSLFQTAIWIWRNPERKPRPLSKQLVLILSLPSLLKYLRRGFKTGLWIWTSFQRLLWNESLYYRTFPFTAKEEQKTSLLHKNHLTYFFFFPK